MDGEGADEEKTKEKLSDGADYAVLTQHRSVFFFVRERESKRER